MGHNQGIEGTNKQIKAAHTFKKRASIGQLFWIIERMLEEWSEKDDGLLFLPRSEGLYGLDGLKLQTEGWQWANSNRKGKADRVVKVDPRSRIGKYSMSESVGLGSVEAIWVIHSSTNKRPGKLTELASVKLEERAFPSNKSFDERMEIHSSCWVLEERDDDFFCDCPLGIKGKMCKHTVR